MQIKMSATDERHGPWCCRAVRPTEVYREAKRHAGPQFTHRPAVDQRLARSHIEGEIVTHLPDGAQP